MKILHYMKSLRVEDGGVVRAVLNLSRLQAEAGAGVTLVTYNAKDAPPGWRGGEPGLPRVVEIPPPGRLQKLGHDALATCEREISACDCVHLHAIWSPSNAQLAKLSRRVGRPYVITVHGMLDDWSMSLKRTKKRVFLWRTGRAMLKNASAVHCCSAEELRQSQKWYPGGRPVVIPLAVDLAPFRELPGRGPAEKAFPQLFDGKPLVLFLSRLHEVKGVDVLIDAVARLRGQGVECRLAIAGTGDEALTAALHMQAERLDLRAVVSFLGMVRGAEKVSLYEAADVFVLPSLHENFGFVLPEALAARTPAITTRFVGLWDELERGGGVVVTDREPNAIAGAIKSLLADPERRQRMGESGRAWVFEHLGGAQVIEEFFACYRRAMGS
ncbi:MAG: glycosyltransferase [Phycisphaeraceae bacterium]|nr:glycosyltransferase [Phycisphaeraceae bacterium]